MHRRTLEATLKLGITRRLLEITSSKIKYLVQDKEYSLDPEENVRAAVYVELVEDYQYSPFRIDLEVQVPRRTPSDHADIVVYEDDQKLSNYIVVETKHENCGKAEFEQAVEQGFGNANSLRSAHLIVDSFDERRVFDVGGSPPNERVKNRISDISVNYGLVPIYLYSRGGRTDLKKVSFSELASIFQRCHDILWSGGKLDPATAFDEMSKILFAKIQDERTTANGRPYRIQVGQNENEVIVAKRCVDLYNEARSIDQYVFTEAIQVSDAKVKNVVEILQSISLTETDLDAKGQAFEKFLGVVFRGELGQYFTRRQLVEFVVDMLEPSESDIVLDPSCGSGGFLLYCVKKVSERIRTNYTGNAKLIDRKIYDFSRQKVYGIEINAKIARVAMMDMIVNDDGHTNIECNTGLNSRFTNPGIGFGKFTLIMTNPPFGVKISRDDKDNLGQSRFDDFEFGKSRKSQVSDILFLEQYRKYLTEDEKRSPRGGVVLQTGVLNNPTNERLLNWIKLNFKILAVVALPDFTFRKAGSGMKTCLLFLARYPETYSELANVPDYKILFAVANHIGYDSTLRPDKNELPIIAGHYRNHTEDRLSGVFWLSLSELDYRLDPLYYSNKHTISKHLNILRKKGHKVVRLRKLLAMMNAGKSPVGGVTRSTGEVPSITITNMTKDGGLDFSQDINFVPTQFAEEFETAKGGLELHDLLIAKDGATTGKTAIVDKSFPFLEGTGTQTKPKAIFSEHVFRLRMKKGVDPLYVHAFLNSDLGQLQLENVTTGGAQGGITLGFANEILVPIVGSKDQKRISAVWESGIKGADRLRLLYDKSIRDLRQNVENAIANAAPIADEDLDEVLKEEEKIENGDS